MRQIGASMNALSDPLKLLPLLKLLLPEYILTEPSPGWMLCVGRACPQN
jgi:hypothetical protein